MTVRLSTPYWCEGSLVGSWFQDCDVCQSAFFHLSMLWLGPDGSCIGGVLQSSLCCAASNIPIIHLEEGCCPEPRRQMIQTMIPGRASVHFFLTSLRSTDNTRF